ncbi:MAG: LVIVD repeat-containing protein [Myxococcota bacterium]
MDDAHSLTTGDGYLVLTSTLNGWSAIHDVSDPSSPTRSSVWTPRDGGVHDETWTGDRLLVAYTSGWACLDVSDPAAPFAVFEAEADCDEPFVQNLAPTWRGDVVAMSEGKVGGSLRVWDEADLDAVSLASEYTTDPIHSIHTVLVRGDTAFAAWFTDGLLGFDLADPASPDLLAQHDTYTSGDQGPGEDGSNNINGATSVWTEGEVVAVADSMRGLVLFTWSISE